MTMASNDYNHHPLPAPPSQGQQEQEYSYSSYDQSTLPQPPLASQQYQSRPQQPLHPQKKQSSYQQQQQQQQQQQPSSQKPERQRPRSRGFSFRSDKSQKTEKSAQGSGHVYKVSSGGLQESHEEKEANRLNSKADPTMAMQEAEPCKRDRIQVADRPDEYTLTVT
jgi:hypothetical protein